MLRLAVGTGGGGVRSSRPRSASLAFPVPAPCPSEPGKSQDSTAHARAAAGKGGDAMEAAVGAECREAGRTPCAVGGGQAGATSGPRTCGRCCSPTPRFGACSAADELGLRWRPCRAPGSCREEPTRHRRTPTPAQKIRHSRGGGGHSLPRRPRSSQERTRRTRGWGGDPSDLHGAKGGEGGKPR
nr:translation initiation factor IF-2-like [Pongo pygmaeus]